ncbi:galectin-4-like isoform X2 [Canis lupus baileyi]
MNKAFWREMVECFNKIAQDPDCRAVVISGAGKVFTAGIDLMDMASEILQPQGDDVARTSWNLRNLITRYQETFSVIEKCPKPVIAAIHGACIGAGVDLITACDIRYCAQDAFFQVKEVDIGLAADVGTLQRLPKIIGNQSLVNELAFTCRTMMADEALASGLVRYKSHPLPAIYHHSLLLHLFSLDEPPAQPLKMAYVPAPGYQPTYNPTLPYNKPIPGGLSVGMSVYIQGITSEHMRRFCVNFVAGAHPGSDIAFHFNPRFDGWDKVVFNSHLGGKWGSEEKKRSMPFRKGTHFELVFMVLAEHYKVVVNGNPFYEFGHRLPLQLVTHLQVEGDVELQSINFIGGTQPLGQGPGHTQQQPSSLPTMEGPPVFNPPVPFRKRLQGGLTVRRTVIIKGFVPFTSKSFVINFMVESSGDLALHINPRLTEGLVVRNSCLNGSWGSEDRKLSYNPFIPGQFFDLSIRCGMDRFKVYANGQHLFDFSHRLLALQNVDMLEISGDVTLSYIQV